ncbi:UNVERIFIED_ORG: glutaredoxin-like protein NrdH [Arthrobacter sp. UYEF2]
MSAPVTSLVILSQPSCVQCTSTYRALNKTCIPYASFNLGDPGEAAAAMAFHEEAQALGYMQAPVGLAKDADGNTVDHWSGFRPDKIAEHTPALLASAPALAPAAA